MSVQKKTIGATLATAAAVMFIAGAAMTAVPTGAKAAEGVKCMGGNACKGQGACKTASNECKGHNGCKGKGFVMTKDAKECAAKGGKVAK